LFILVDAVDLAKLSVSLSYSWVLWPP